MKRGILFISLHLIISFSYCQSNPEDIIKKFFLEYSKNPSNAIDQIYSTNPWNSRIKDGIENMKKEVESYNLEYVGKYYGNELIVKKQFSESFILYSYMLKYERLPLRFIFEFYKPDKEWNLYSLKIDANLDDEIEQSARLYYLNLER
ncbi:MAG: hypothetical protein LCH35_07945 [Bacteroidetes bacterium]|nr:hypothetical protein [Bacteroidota bacterium]